MAGIPLINSMNYDWGGVSLVLFGVPVTQITKIAYSRKQKMENNYGAGHVPVSRGYGNIEFEGSIEMYLDQWMQIIALAPNNDPFQIPAFDIPVIYGNNGVTPVKDVLRAVQFYEDPLNASQGETKLMVNIPLIIGQIDRNAQ